LGPGGTTLTHRAPYRLPHPYGSRGPSDTAGPEIAYPFTPLSAALQTSPAVCNPTPTSRPIIDSSNACNQTSAHILCIPLHGPVQFAIRRGVRLVGQMFSPKLPLPLRGSSPHVTLFLGPTHSSSQTASRSIQPLLYGFQNPSAMLYNASSMGNKPPKLPLPLGISSPCRKR